MIMEWNGKSCSRFDVTTIQIQYIRIKITLNVKIN